MIVVTGATGKLGSRVVEHLLARVPPDQVGVSVRDPAAAAPLADRGVRVRRGDFGDPAGLDAAFAGADTVLVVSSGNHGEVALTQHRAAVDAARRAGARVVYTSHMGASFSSRFPPMRVHAATEAMLQEAGVPFTSLRNGYYTASAIMLLGDAVGTGVLAVPEDGPVAWTAHDDLAEAAAIVLAAGDLDGTGDRFDGPTPPLTAGAALDMSGVASVASELIGRPVTVRRISDQQHRSNLLAKGLPEAAADFILTIFDASRHREFAVVDPTLEKLLGRPPRTARDVLAEHLRPTAGADWATRRWPRIEARSSDAGPRSRRSPPRLAHGRVWSAPGSWCSRGRSPASAAGSVRAGRHGPGS